MVIGYYSTDLLEQRAVSYAFTFLAFREVGIVASQEVSRLSRTDKDCRSAKRPNRQDDEHLKPCPQEKRTAIKKAFEHFGVLA